MNSDLHKGDYVLVQKHDISGSTIYQREAIVITVMRIAPYMEDDMFDMEDDMFVLVHYIDCKCEPYGCIPLNQVQRISKSINGQK